MKKVILKMPDRLFDELNNTIFRNYPQNEWGLFLKTNWSETEDAIFITLNEIIAFSEDDISYGKGTISFHEPYLVKTVGCMAREKIGVAVVHSHPESIPPLPSLIDDDMDEYFQSYFESFNEAAPYLSLIFGRTADGRIEFTGRGVYKKKSFSVHELRIVGKRIRKLLGKGIKLEDVPKIIKDRLERLTDSYGPEAAIKLWYSEVTIVGCGGTGSPSAHSLARSNVGTINLIDFDILNLNNSERVHGSFLKYLLEKESVYKVEVVRDLIHLINPLIKVNIYKGSVLDSEARAMILRSDLVLNCTDTEHAKVAISEYVWRYFVVALQVNVSIESTNSTIDGQIIHLTYLYPGGPCAYCIDMINAQRLSNELMSGLEVAQRKEAELKAREEGVEDHAYWVDEPIVPTVGALATIGGEMISNYAVGLITEAFAPVSIFSEKNLLSSFPDVHLNLNKKKNCLCESAYGKSDQAGAKKVIIS